MYAEVIEDKISLTATWQETTQAKTIPGIRWSTDTKTWTLPLTWEACVTLQGIIGSRLTLGPYLIEWMIRENVTRIEPVMSIKNLTEWPAHWTGVNFDSRLYSYQQVGVYFLLLAGSSAILGDEMAGGKGVQSLAAMRILYLAGQPVLPALVVCPNSVKRHWEREIGKWFPEAQPYVVSGTQAQRNKAIAYSKLDPHAIVIVNIEAIRKLSRIAGYGSIRLKKCQACDPRGDAWVSVSACEVHQRPLNDYGFRHVILDEAHRIKDPKSVQTRAFWFLASESSVTRRWALTGTMIANHVGDLWSILHGIAPREYPVYSTWLERYALMSWGRFGGMEVVGLRPDTCAEFFRAFDPRYRRMTLALVQTQIPVTIRKIRYVELTPAQRKIYTELQKKLITTTEAGELFIAPNDMVASTRLLQISSGTVDVTKPDQDDTSTWQYTVREPSQKIDELMRVHDELDGARYVVAALHRDVINMAAARYDMEGVKYAVATGGQTELERDNALQQLIKGEIQVLLTTISTSREGLDFSAVETMVFLQRSWSMVDTLQIEARHSPARRIGSDRNKAARIIDIVTTDTIEEVQLQRLLQKMEMLEEINQDRAALVLNGQDVTSLNNRYSKITSSSLGQPWEDQSK